MEPEEVQPKRYSVPDLAVLYKRSVRTIRRMVHFIKPELGKRHGHHFSPEQISIFFKKYGTPILVFFGIIRTSNAKAGSAQSYVNESNSVLTNQASVLQNSSDRTFYPAVLVISFLASVYLMVHSIKSVIERFYVDNPTNRQKAIERANNADDRLIDILSVFAKIMYVSTLCIVVIVGGICWVKWF